MRKDEIVELEIESIGFQGVSVARKDGIVYFVKGAVPGDLVQARIRKKRRRYFETDIVEIIKPSEQRTKPECDYFGICGGCSWQHLDYERQMFWKRQHIIDSFERIGKIEVGEIGEILPSIQIYNYRNKMEFSFGTSRWLTKDEINSENDITQKDFALGLHVPGRFDKVIDVHKCHLQDERGNRILNIIREKALELELKAFDTQKHNGFLRNLIIRSSGHYKELMILLITNDTKTEQEHLFLDWYYSDSVETFPEATVISHAVNNTFSPVTNGEAKIIKGPGYITENILDVDFRISPFSFFQTNSFQLNRFISEIIKISEIKKEQLAWDLYCGTGSISLPLSRHCTGVIGIDIFEGSIADAQSNAALNGIDNAEFISADLHGKEVPELLNALPKPDIIFIDPPRAGMHKNLISHLLKINTERIIYVSCNPTTQARDCELLAEGYNVKYIKPVDMFPHTFHVESIALLERKGIN